MEAPPDLGFETQAKMTRFCGQGCGALTTGFWDQLREAKPSRRQIRSQLFAGASHWCPPLGW